MEHRELLDVDAIVVPNDRDKYCDSDDSMMEPEDRGYLSEDDLLSVCASSRACSPSVDIVFLRNMDEEMLCT